MQEQASDSLAGKRKALSLTTQPPSHGHPPETGGSFAQTPEIESLIDDVILRSLDDDKAEDVLVIDLAGKSSLADAMIVASGRSQRHVGALADHLMRKLKDAGVGKVRVEGLPQCDWVLLDAGDVIVHVFRPEVRAFYGIDRMWDH